MIANSLAEFSMEAARRYLQNAVFIDDNIYNQVTASPASPSEIRLRQLKKPIVEERAAETQPAAAEDPAGDLIPPPFRTKDLVGCFAAHNIVCALYEPEKNFPTDENSVVFKLCDTADLVVLDWDFNEVGVTGGKPRELITNLIRSGNRVAPHHVRLVAIYTTTPSLKTVANSVFQHLQEHQVPVTVIGEPGLRLQCGSTRVLVLGKEVGYRADDEKPFSVPETTLAERLISEFASMNAGLMPSCALLGMAEVRKNSLRILNKFSARLDGQFLLHRALVRGSGEAFEDLPELFADEFRAVIEDGEYYPENLSEFVGALAEELPMLDADWTVGQAQEPAHAVVRRFLTEDLLPAQFDKIRKKPREVTKLMGTQGGSEFAEFAALLSGRTSYRMGNLHLGFGTIVRRMVPGNNGEVKPEYSLCFIPACDSIRLAGPVTFPFWRLAIEEGKGSSQCVTTPSGERIELVLSGKGNRSLWSHQFAPAASQRVEFATNADGRQICTSDGVELEWIAQLKPSHAQRLAHEIGVSFSRVGLVEAEWLRLQYS